MNPEPVSPEFLLLQAAVAGRYSLVRELGRGGMGVVFLAREVALDRPVAIKLLPPALAVQPGYREHFLREARTAAQLSHPHIVSIHAVVEVGELVFFVMEYVPGETLGDRLRRVGALPAGETLRIVQEVAWALAHAHARGVIHRDIKPDNVLLEEGTDRALVADFGIARGGEPGTTPARGMGTLHYMSPEQAAGHEADARADVYALGVTAFHAVSGRRPFDGYDGAALLAVQSRNAPPPIRTLVPTLPAAFAEVIDRAIVPEPGDRWPSAEAMAQQLAAARALSPQLPPALRTFGRISREQLERSGAAFLLGVATEAVLVIGFGWNDLAGIVFHAMASLLLGISVLSLGGILTAARELLQRGYGHAAAMKAVAWEEAEFAALPPAMRRRDWRYSPVLIMVFTILIVGVAIGTVRRTESFAPGMLAVLVAVYAPVLAFRALQRRFGFLRDWWARLMRGRFGRGLFRLAGIGVPAVPATATPGEPTALALGGAIGQLYAALPEAQQRALGAVPELIDRLAAMALDRNDARATEAVMALETLRIDLLRLRAGEMAAESLTEDLERLREVGYRVDAALEVRLEFPATNPAAVTPPEG